MSAEFPGSLLAAANLQCRTERAPNPDARESMERAKPRSLECCSQLLVGIEEDRAHRAPRF